ncbi:MAG TPA: HNH endonuclease signature motif containing protein, partial [Jatrophihabitantaceae bacterium]|nr:HNH endonuclease signature motif containing protein [Jatrophihabitantaceae bacterium]
GLPTTERAGAARPSAVNVVTIAEATLAGRDDEPADLQGHGPISADHAREIVGRPGTVLRELRVDPQGRLLQYGTDRPGRQLDYARSTRTAPADLDRYIRARDVTCRFPSCTRPAATAELDHITPWSDGGPTSAANLHALCARHHHARHEGRWKVRRTHDGTTCWTSPTGHHYQVPPHTYQPYTARGPDPPT